MKTAIIAAVVFCLAFFVGVWTGESRVQHGVDEQACHLAGGHWAADFGSGKCVEVLHVGH